MTRTSPATDRILIVTGFFFIFLGWLSARYNFDGVVFAFFLGQADHGNPGMLWHPHHLLYGPLNYFVFHLLLGKVDYLLSMQLLNVLFGCGALLIFHATAFRFLGNRLAAGAATAGLGASYAFWFYSIEPEVYVPHAFFVLLGLWLAASEGEGKKSFARAALLGLAAAMIPLTHLSGVLFAPGIAAAILWPAGSPRPGFGRRSLLRLSVATVAAVGLLAGWYAAGITTNPQADEVGIMTWLSGATYPETGDIAQGHHWSLPPDSLPALARGWRRALLAKGSWHSLALLPLPVLALLYLGRLPRLLKTERRRHLLFLIYYLPTLLFFTVFEPGNYEMKVSLLPALWLVVGAGAGGEKWRRPRMAAFCTVPVLLLALNFFGAIRLDSDPANNPDLVRARFVRDHTEPNAVIYISGSGEFAADKIYLLYFAGRENRIGNWILGGPDPAGALRNSLAADSGRPIYFTRDLADTRGETFRRLANRLQVSPEALAAAFRDRLRPVPGGPTDDASPAPYLYRYTP